MADIIKKATNKFTKGLVMDFSPENTRNEVLTHALNATLLTFNGNELSLLNDMGNARVETAFLPTGYIPVGTCEYGGILYIVSYNPLENKSLIGCFPSPERNISSKELGLSDKEISRSSFLNFVRDSQNNLVPDGTIVNTSSYVLLKNDNLNPGDKFLICADPSIYDEQLQDLLVKNEDGEYIPVANPIIALNIVSIEESGKITYLNSDIKLYTYDKVNSETEQLCSYLYHILGDMLLDESGSYSLEKVDIDSYRNVLSSGYSVFRSKTSGKLAILAELITIDSYSVTHSILPKIENGTIIEGSFDVIVYPEISPVPVNTLNNTIPQLKYYYLDKSLGYIQTADGLVPLFLTDGDIVTNKFNPSFKSVKLSDIYEPTTDVELNLNKSLGNAGSFNFPKTGSYHGRMESYEFPEDGNITEKVYTKFKEGKYHKISKSLVVKDEDYDSFMDFYVNDLNAKFYYYDSEGQQYQEYLEDTIEESYTYYVIKKNSVYTDAKRDENLKDKSLYKLETVPQAATEKEINDTSIEKFLYVDIHTYRKATEENFTDGSILYEETAPNVYESITGFPDKNKEYFVLKTEKNLKSIGYSFNWEDFPGEIYWYPTEKLYVPALQDDINAYFDFVTYPLTSTAPYGCPITLYTIEIENSYELATDYQVYNHLELGITLYYDTNYILIAPNLMLYYNPSMGQLFIVVPMDNYVSTDKFVPSKQDNYIEGDTSYTSDYEKDDPISLHTVADFIPKQVNEDDKYLLYEALKLANIKIPRTVSANGLDLPFKYDYSLVPCMNYGRLDHLKVSNTIDFGKLHAFNQSDFTVWKYHIDDNLLRLTFGAEVFDTYENDKVDGLVLEFYDLRGFAGSIEITDKKAYSGLFTKIISLNSLGAISNRKVSTGGYSDTYKHNINIIEKTPGNYYLGDYLVTYSNYANGWKHVDSKLPEMQNDCGTLYSNVLYGVKTYLRRTVNGTKEFIKKKEFFLYTIPIYNDLYYTCDYFGSLEFPQLELVLTYKLLDSSTKYIYNDSPISEGYTQTDKNKVGSYLSGFCDDTTLDITKYYKYSGTSSLFLEIGLKQDYSSYNLSYDPLINSMFSCSLKLVSDTDANKTFTINSGIEDLINEEVILNYNNTTESLRIEDLNYVTFDNSSNIFSSSKTDFYNKNFIHNNGNDPIKITYLFVVGYKTSITDIKNTEVPATTVCALFHKLQSGEYNYSDFGIYRSDENSNWDIDYTNTNLLSSALFLNRGTSSKEILSICRLKSASTDTAPGQIDIVSSVETDATDISIPGKLNTGDKLKQLNSLIGKLTFCQPHAHAYYSTEGVNVNEFGNILSTSQKKSGQECQAYDLLSKYAQYNLCVNTKNMIMHNSEFISTMHYESLDGDNDSGRKFVGLNYTEVKDFNYKMLRTMSQVYAYNPDYDTLQVNLGTLSKLSYDPYFTSNIINTHSYLDFNDGTTFNDYISIGPVIFSKYLRDMNNFSVGSDGLGVQIMRDSEYLPQVQLMPNYTYCGTEDAPYLISSLTYNTPVPEEILLELEFTASNLTVVKHTDGTNSFVSGQVNKKGLYGYNTLYQKLVQYDVTNYKIDQNTGDISFTNVSVDETQTPTQNYDRVIKHGQSFNYNFEGQGGDISDLLIGPNWGVYSYPSSNINKKTYIPNPIRSEDGWYVYIIDSTSEGHYLDVQHSLNVRNSNANYKYEVGAIKYITENKGRRLKAGSITVDSLKNMSFNEIQNIVDNRSDLWKSSTNKDTQIVYARSGGNKPITELVEPANETHKTVPDYLCTNNTKWRMWIGENDTVSLGIDIYMIKVTSVTLSILRKSSLSTYAGGVVSVNRKAKYSSVKDHVYLVSYPLACLCHTSITLNDLLYEPNKEEHRLFMRNDNYIYDDHNEGRLFYRVVSSSTDSSWAKSTANYNSLYLYTGPCFI